ncbi:hypothetical protein HKX48_008688 [Thoreauomyces humboldtii]|nr:hypothetical protein HKX48_008688 [Thoreauomyces humboldtii]
MPNALFLKGKNSFAVDQVEKPSAKAGEIVIQTKAVAISSQDLKRANHGESGQFGSDVSGIVADAGSSNLKVGDEVFARAQTNGFSEYSTALVGSVSKKPTSLSFEQAAVAAGGLHTAIAALFWEKALSLARPQEQRKWFAPEFVIIGGGASATGAYAVQLAAAAGYAVIATAAPEHHEDVRKFGAIHVVDPSRGDLVEELKKRTGGGRSKAALDTTGGDASVKLAGALKANTDRPSIVVSIADPDLKALSVPDGVHVKSVTGQEPEVQAFAAEVLSGEVLEYLAQGRIKPGKATVVDGGLSGVQKALERAAAANGGETFVSVL